MSDFVHICAANELPKPGELAEYTVSGRAVCVANLNGSISVLDGTCPHEGGPLAEGSIEDGRVVCPWHSFAFDLKSGACEQDPDLHAQVFVSIVDAGELKAKL